MGVRLRTELEKEKYRSWQGAYKPYVTNKSGIFMHYNEVFNLINAKTA
ncbi:MAG: hypothetical protein J6C23_05490 [Clostridia bacterium]|nr:hypothetical protein [Clostridia bacterium]